MATVQPPTWMQNSCVSAQGERDALGTLLLEDGVESMGTPANPGTWAVRGGVDHNTLLVSPGAGYIRDKSGRGVYHVATDSNVTTVALPAAQPGTGDRSLTLWATVRDSAVPGTGGADLWSFEVSVGNNPPAARAGALQLALILEGRTAGIRNRLDITDTRRPFRINNAASTGTLLGTLINSFRRDWGTGAASFDIELDFADRFPGTRPQRVIMDIVTEGGAGGTAPAGGAATSSVGGGGGQGWVGKIQVDLDVDNPKLRVYGSGGPSGGFGFQRPDWAAPFAIGNGGTGAAYTLSSPLSYGFARGGAPVAAYVGGAAFPGMKRLSNDALSSRGKDGLATRGMLTPNNSDAFFSRGGDGGGGDAAGGLAWAAPANSSAGRNGIGAGNVAFVSGGGGGGGVRAGGATAAALGGYGGAGSVVISVYA